MEEEKREVHPGGSFLFKPVGDVWLLSPEGFTEEQRMYYRTSAEFSKKAVEPLAERIEKKDNALLRQLLKQAGEQGLLMVDIPERYGGLGGDLTTTVLVAEAMTRLASWSVTHGAHTGIGTLPIVYFGTHEQKERYLPKLATGEWIAAYALTEPGSGSDALGAHTTAKLSADGKHYVLNGSKQFITNGGFADIFVVFAKVEGKNFTGFIVERNTPGFSVGAEEHKMGIRGSSTTALTFEDVQVPVANVLGEIGKGHKIAFNILNIGRLKLGVGTVGGGRAALERALRYATDRKQFETPILEFPLIREKLARMASLIYMNESMAYRTTGLIDGALAHLDRASPDYATQKVQVLEEYAIESSILKVFGSEALAVIVDEAVQVHGGVGYIEEFPVERAYRDARINRIFEGTNEINRMLITGMLLKRTLKGQLPYMEFAQSVDDEFAQNRSLSASVNDALAKEEVCAERIKRMVAVALRVAVERWGMELEKHQEILASIADVASEAFALDSSVTRTRQASSDGKLDPVRVALVQQHAVEAQSRALDRARKAVCACLSGDEAQPALQKLDRLFRYQAYDLQSLREIIVRAVIDRGGYPFPIA
jgi:alkylation response protein AidB-like acyl-CoA dehydrogenase